MCSNRMEGQHLWADGGGGAGRGLVRGHTWHEERGWEFLFVADNIDAVRTADEIGIRADRAVKYCVEEATPLMFREMSDTISCYRRAGEVRSDWAEKIKK